MSCYIPSLKTLYVKGRASSLGLSVVCEDVSEVRCRLF